MCFTVKVMQPKLHLTLVGNDRGWSCCDVYTRVDSTLQCGAREMNIVDQSYVPDDVHLFILLFV